MTRFTIDASELADFARELEAASPKVRRDVSAALTRGINDIQREAISRAPRDRPWLQSNIKIKRGAKTLTRTVETGEDPEGKPVGIFQEFGTSEFQPQPFMFPAYESVVPRVTAEIFAIVGVALSD